MKKDTKNNIVNFPSNSVNGEREVEAILFAAAEPLDIDTIESKVKKNVNVKKILEKLQHTYSNRGINLVCISNKWSFRTAQNLSKLMSQEKTVEKKLSKAAIETLAIIVYHQPVTRAEIEEIRGVAFGTNTLEILMELNWVKPQGRKNVPGKPGKLLQKSGSGYSLGGGVGVKTPIGPLRLDVASKDLSGDWRYTLGVGWKF